MGLYFRRNEFLNAIMRVLLDMSCITAVFVFTVWLHSPTPEKLFPGLGLYKVYYFTLLIVWFMVATDQRLFLSRRSEAVVALLFSVAKAYVTAFLFTVFAIALLMESDLNDKYHFMEDELNRTFLFQFGIFVLGGLLLFRLTLGLSLWNLRRRGFNARRILIIGSNERTQKLVDILHANEQYGYHIEGFLEIEPERREMLEARGVPYLGALDELDKILISRVIDAVYIALPVRSYYEKIQSAAHLCEGVGVPVRFMADLFPLRMATSELSRLGDVPLLSLSIDSDSRPQFALHRAVDMGVSLLLIAVLSPVLLLVALAIKLDSRGPLLVRRPRKAPGGVEFSDLVFRTTRDASWDTREENFTRVGRILKRYGIDELPQLLNVLSGEISLAGPVHDRGQASKIDSPV